MKAYINYLPLIALLILIGCGSTMQSAKPIKTYRIATRQLPPEPVFSSTRWVRPPDIKPARTKEAKFATTKVSPVMHLKLANTPLKDAILVFASPLRYQTYCANSIANRKLTIDSLGTIDELASEINRLTDIKVVVDHNLKEVRFISSADS